MAISIPMGVACFLPVAFVMGELGRLAQFPAAAAWMAGVGVLHFVFGRYCNYSANQAAGVNLTAPVIQLQVIVTLVLAVTILHEPCTVLQAIGGVLIVVGSIVTQQQRSWPTPSGLAAAPVAEGRKNLRASCQKSSKATSSPRSRRSPMAPRRSRRALRSSTPGRPAGSSAA